MKVEVQRRAEHVVPEPASPISDLDGGAHGGDRVRVLGPDVDVALAGSDRIGGDRHALDERERIAFHHHPVGERAAVAFVGVAADELQLVDAVEHRLPLDAGREARPAAATQAGVGDLRDDLCRGILQCANQTDQTAVSQVIVGGQRIGHAHPGERDAILRGEPGQVVDHSDTLRQLGTVEQACCDKAVDIGCGDWPIADPPTRRLYLDQWFQPQHSAGAVADQSNRATLPLCGLRQSVGHLIRANGACRGIPWHVDADRRRQRVHRATASSNIDVNRASSSRPRSLPLTCAAGPNAQLPRQKTCSTVNEPSGLVSPSDMPQASCR